MSMRLSNKKKSLFVIVALFFGSMAFVVHAAEPLVFDTLFPVTPYKKVLTMSMRIAGDIADSANALHDNQNPVHDVIVGRIVRLSFLVHVLYEQHHLGVVNSDDYAYLLACCMRIAAAYRSMITQETALAGVLLDDSTASLRQLI